MDGHFQLGWNGDGSARAACYPPTRKAPGADLRSSTRGAVADFDNCRRCQRATTCRRLQPSEWISREPPATARGASNRLDEDGQGLAELLPCYRTVPAVSPSAIGQEPPTRPPLSGTRTMGVAFSDSCNWTEGGGSERSRGQRKEGQRLSNSAMQTSLSSPGRNLDKIPVPFCFVS